MKFMRDNECHKQKYLILKENNFYAIKIILIKIF